MPRRRSRSRSKNRPPASRSAARIRSAPGSLSPSPPKWRTAPAIRPGPASSCPAGPPPAPRRSSAPTRWAATTSRRRTTAPAANLSSMSRPPRRRSRTAATSTRTIRTKKIDPNRSRPWHTIPVFCSMQTTRCSILTRPSAKRWPTPSSTTTCPTTNRRSTPITRSTAACGTAWPKASSTKTGCLPSVSASTSRRWACRITAKAAK